MAVSQVTIKKLAELTTFVPSEQISILNALRADGVQGIAVFPIDNEQVKILSIPLWKAEYLS